MVFDLVDCRAEYGWRFLSVSDFVIPCFAGSKDGVTAKSSIVESNSPGLIKEVFKLVVGAIGHVAFGGQGKGAIFISTIGVANRPLRPGELAGKQDG